MKTKIIVLKDRQPSPHIFLCHAHQDKRFVRRLSRDLTTLNINVWLDEWELTVGDTLHECIGEALEKAAYVGVVLSPDSVNSRWCKDELQQALTREKREGKKVVLPLLHRRVQVPPFLEGRLHLNFSRSYATSVAGLAGLIHGIDSRKLASALQDRPPASIGDVQVLIHGLMPHNAVKFIAKRKYEKIWEAFKVANIDISKDAFKLYTDRNQSFPILFFDIASEAYPPEWNVGQPYDDFLNTEDGEEKSDK